jgi:hypothetical protein
MTRLQTPPRQQRIPLHAEQQNAAGIAAQVSPLEAMTAMQIAAKGAKEQIRETQLLRPITAETADGILRWAGEDSLDWDRLIGSIEGWGKPEH